MILLQWFDKSHARSKQGNLIILGNINESRVTILQKKSRKFFKSQKRQIGWQTMKRF